MAMVLAVLISLLVYQLWLSYRDQVKTAQISTRNLAAILETRFESTLRRTDADLIALALEIPVEALHKDAVPNFQQEMSVRLNSRLYNVERTDGFHVFDAEGDALYSSDSVPAHRMNVADRSYFRRLREAPGAGLVFSEVVNSRISGRDIVVLARALRDREGHFLGAIINPLDLEAYRRQFQTIDVGPQGLIALRRSDNHSHIVRWPELPEEVNTRLAFNHPVVQSLSAGEGEATLEYTAYSDGLARIVSIKRMRDYPFYFAVGVAKREVLAGWYVQVGVVGLLVLMILVIVGTLLMRLGRMREREMGILTDLAKSELQFTELAQMVPVGIAHFDHGGRCTYVNDRYMALTLRDESALLGSGLWDFVYAADHETILSAWAGRGDSEGVFTCEYRLEAADKQIVHVLGEIKTKIDEQGKVVGHVAALTDISFRKEAEAELLVAKQEAESANLAKTRFLAAASHDLRQPIQAINLFRDALGRTPLSEEQKSICSYLSMSVRLLGELLYSLLDISKLEAGVVKPQFAAVPVEDLLKLVDAEFSPLSRQKNLRFKLFYPFKSPVLMTDSALLLSVLRNLIDNAFKNTESGGVLVGVRKRGGRAIIQVWDTGIGIAPEFSEQIFEECFQIGNPLRDRTKGFGIGLSIARRTARLLGGDVVFHSCLGRGTVFEVTLPIVEACEVSEDGRREAVLSESGLPEIYADLAAWRVVVIEDDPVVAKSVEFSLQTLGVEVVVFQDAEVALACSTILGADFYVSDFSLPGLNGLQLLDEIQRRSLVPIKAVLITGETAPERIKLASGSPWRVLFKPVELAALLEAMRLAAKSRSPL